MPTGKKRRANKEGTVWWDEKAKRWRARITIQTHAGPKSKTVSAKTQAEVIRKKAQAIAERDSGLHYDAEDMTLEEYLIRWLRGPAKKNVRESTYVRYEQCSRLHLIPALGRMKLKKLTAIHLEELYDRKLEEHLAPRTVNYIHTTASKALSYAVSRGLLRHNAAALAVSPRPKSPEMRYLSREQVRTFLAACTEERLYALYVLALSTGMRRSEILGLTWEDVDLEAGLLEIRRGLTVSPAGGVVLDDPKRFSSRRQIDLGEETVAVLRAHRKHQAEERLAAPEWREDGFVFTTHMGGYLHPQTLYTAYFKPLVKRTEGVPDITFHELRHTYATLALRNGVPVDVVSKTLGHKDIATTLRCYAHVLPGMGAAAARAMNQLLFN